MLGLAAALPQRRLYAAAKCRAISQPLVSASAKGQPPSSAFTGVSRAKGEKQWRAQIVYGGKLVHLGQYDSEEEAARTWDKAAVRIKPHDGKLKLNLSPLQDYLDDQNSPLPDPRIEALLRGDPALAGKTKGGKQLSSAFTGVVRRGMTWKADISHGSKRVQLGYYDTEEEAARTWDKAAVRIRPHDWKLKLNFPPLQDYLDAEDRPLPEPRIEALLRGDKDDPALAGKTMSGKQLSSAFVGVGRRGVKWEARISHGGKTVHLGNYDTEEMAARAWDKAAVLSRPHEGIKLNYPLQDYLDAEDQPLPEPRIEAQLRGDKDDSALAGKSKSGKQLSSAFVGVTRVGMKWEARIDHGGKTVNLGLYDREEEAARARDKAAVLSRPGEGIQLNFPPLQDYLDAEDKPLPEPRIEALLRGDKDDPALAVKTKPGKHPSSAFPGVSRIGMKWKAQIRQGGKQVHLGLYDTEEEAARTWDKAAVLSRPHDLKLQLQLNFPLQDYLDAQDQLLPDLRIEALLRGDPDNPALAGKTRGGKQRSSEFTGVKRAGMKWEARISHGGRMVHLGHYNSEEEAARTWDKAAVLTRPQDGTLKLNYPLQDYLDAEDKPLPAPRIEALLHGDKVNPALAGKSKQLTSAALRG